MIRMISGATRIDNKTYQPSDGAFEVDSTIENRLVRLGVAEFVITGVATPDKQCEDCEPSVNLPEIENASEGDFEGTESAPAYSINSKVGELRAIAEKVGIKFKVGTTKEEMISTLDAHFGVSSEDGIILTAEEPVN